VRLAGPDAGRNRRYFSATGLVILVMAVVGAVAGIIRLATGAITI
jgi:hypothetical protein